MPASEEESFRKRYCPCITSSCITMLFAVWHIVIGLVCVSPIVFTLVVYNYLVWNYDDLKRDIKRDGRETYGRFNLSHILAEKMLFAAVDKYFKKITWILSINGSLLGSLSSMWFVLKYPFQACYAIITKNSDYLVSFYHYCKVLWWTMWSIFAIPVILFVMQLSSKNYDFISIKYYIYIGVTVITYQIIYRICVNVVNAAYGSIIKRKLLRRLALARLELEVLKNRSDDDD